MKLVHWPLMGGVLHLVQQGWDGAELQPAQALPHCTLILPSPPPRFGKGGGNDEIQVKGKEEANRNDGRFASRRDLVEKAVLCLGILWSSTFSGVWLRANTLVSINVVTLRQARLVPGWMTVFGRVNHLGAEPGTA